MTEPSPNHPLGNCASLFRSYHGRVSAITFVSPRSFASTYSARRVRTRGQCSLRSFYMAMMLLAVAQLPLVAADLPEVDCVMPAPGPWGACDAHGVQKRTQVVPRCFCQQSSTGASPGRGGNEEPDAVHCGDVQHSRQCAGSLATENCRLGQWGSWGACARGFRDRKRPVPLCMCQSFGCCPPDPTNGDGWECHDSAAQSCFVETEQLASNEKVSCKHVQVTSPTAQSQALAGVFSFDWREMCDEKAVWVRPAKGSAPKLFSTYLCFLRLLLTHD